jgi:hypothetical protein
MTEFLVIFSQETRHAWRDFSTVNLRTTTLNGVGVLIDHYTVTRRRSLAVRKVCSVQLQGVGSRVTLGD